MLQNQCQMGFEKYNPQHFIFCCHRRLPLMFPNSADCVPLVFRSDPSCLVSDMKKILCCFQQVILSVLQ